MAGNNTLNQSQTVNDLTDILVESSDPQTYEPCLFRPSQYYDMEGFIDYIISNNDVLNSELKVMHLNIQSLMSKHLALQEIIAHLGERRIVLDCILLCETFVHENNIQLLNIDGYKLISRHRSERKRGGVAIYVNDSLSYENREDLNIFIEGHFESIFIDIPMNNKKFTVGEIYRVPNTNQQLSIERYNETFKKLRNMQNVIIGTDQNFDLLKIDSNPSSNDLLNNALEHALIPSITKPTRITHTTATLIDNIYHKYDDKLLTNSAILVTDISDHLPVFLFVKFEVSKHDTDIPQQRKHRKINERVIQNITQDLNKLDWQNIFKQIDTEESCNLLHDILKASLDRHAPLNYMTHKSSGRKHVPWMTNDLLKAIRNNEQQYKKCIDKPRTHPAYKHYIKSRNELNRQKRSIRRSYVNNLLEKHKGDMKKNMGNNKQSDW
jgi:cellulose biosynthesis protein BcsQ